MPWEKVKPKQQYGQTATIRKDGIALSGEFITQNKLDDFLWVEVFVDDSLRRVGFKFHSAATGSTLRLSRESKAGRMIQTKGLGKSKWINELVQLQTPDRRFLIDIDGSVKDPTVGVRYFVNVGYRFQAKREFPKTGDYPRLPAVYRLFYAGELVRIGEADDLERRLKQHHREYGEQVEYYDFAEIPDPSARKFEEKRLLGEFKDAHGRLPKFNQITA